MNFLLKVVIGSDNGTVLVNNEDFTLYKLLKAHATYIFRIKQSPFNNNDNIATCSEDKTVKIWTFNWTLIRNYAGHVSAVYGLEWINSDTIASGSADKTIQIWSISTEQTYRTINTGYNVISLKLLSNGFYLAAGLGYPSNNAYKINIYNINTGKLITSLLGHTSYVRDLVLINNGNLLASSSDDSTVRIWDLNTNSTMFTLTGHTSSIYGLKQITNDILSSGSYDTKIKLWNITSGTLIRTLSNHTNKIWRSLDLLNDGQTLVSGSLDQTIKYWNMSTGQILQTINTGYKINSLAVISSKLLQIRC